MFSNSWQAVKYSEWAMTDRRGGDANITSNDWVIFCDLK